MAIAMMRQTLNNAILTVETAVDHASFLISVQIVLVLEELLVLMCSILYLVMVIAMTRQTMFTAYMMALTAADLPLIQTPALIAYVMVSLSLYTIHLFLYSDILNFELFS